MGMTLYCEWLVVFHNETQILPRSFSQQTEHKPLSPPPETSPAVSGLQGVGSVGAELP